MLMSCTTTTSKKNKTLKVMSYNIRHGQGMDNKIDLDRIANVISAQNPDLVALQEIDKICKRSNNFDIAKELGERLNMAYRFGEFMNYQNGEYGMAILSKFPINKTIRHELPKGTEPRCALEVDVQTNISPQSISFICIHNDWKNVNIRVLQIKELLNQIKDVKKPVVLAGDFNGTPSDPSLDLLRKNNWNILDKNNQKTFPSDSPNKEIDFVVTRNFPSSKILHYTIAETKASDHRPIVAEFIIND